MEELISIKKELQRENTIPKAHGTMLITSSVDNGNSRPLSQPANILEVYADVHFIYKANAVRFQKCIMPSARSAKMKTPQYKNGLIIAMRLIEIR